MTGSKTGICESIWAAKKHLFFLPELLTSFLKIIVVKHD